MVKKEVIKQAFELMGIAKNLHGIVVMYDNDDIPNVVVSDINRALREMKCAIRHLM